MSRVLSWPALQKVAKRMKPLSPLLTSMPPRRCSQPTVFSHSLLFSVCAGAALDLLSALLCYLNSTTLAQVSTLWTRPQVFIYLNCIPKGPTSKFCNQNVPAVLIFYSGAQIWTVMWQVCPLSFWFSLNWLTGHTKATVSQCSLEQLL